MIMWPAMFVAVFAAMLVGYDAAPKKRQKIDLFVTINMSRLGRKHAARAANRAARTGTADRNKQTFQIRNQVTSKDGLIKQPNGPVEPTNSPGPELLYGPLETTTERVETTAIPNVEKQSPTDGVNYNNDYLISTAYERNPKILDDVAQQTDSTIVNKHLITSFPNDLEKINEIDNMNEKDNIVTYGQNGNDITTNGDFTNTNEQNENDITTNGDFTITNEQNENDITTNGDFTNTNEHNENDITINGDFIITNEQNENDITTNGDLTITNEQNENDIFTKGDFAYTNEQYENDIAKMEILL